MGGGGNCKSICFCADENVFRKFILWKENPFNKGIRKVARFDLIDLLKTLTFVRVPSSYKYTYK